MPRPKAHRSALDHWHHSCLGVVTYLQFGHGDEVLEGFRGHLLWPHRVYAWLGGHHQHEVISMGTKGGDLLKAMT